MYQMTHGSVGSVRFSSQGDHPDVLNSDQIGRSDLPLTVDGSGSRDLHRMVAIVRDLGDARGAIAIFINRTAGGGLAS